MIASTTLPCQLSGGGGNLGNENMIASTTLPCQVTGVTKKICNENMIAVYNLILSGDGGN